ncbi:MAG: phosphotransferase [Solirubrobacteraceae bacterium]|nr:phosphotransferase [Solirubrobacteraceae bacterium]
MAKLGYGIEHWSSPAWRAEAGAWIDAQLAGAGLARTGAVRQPHLRPWATVLSAPTSAGTVWLKAAGPATAFEIGFYELLGEVAPAGVLVPLAIDVERAWMLLPDGGEPLAERFEGEELIAPFATALRRYGALQRALAPHADRMLELGIADMRPTVLVQRFDEAVQAVGERVAADGSDEDRGALRRAAGMRGEVAAWCEQLAAAPGGVSVDHNDLHPWNVLAGGPTGEDVRFYDWGDCVVAHPFASMLEPLVFMQSTLSCASGDPRLVTLRDAYLEAYADRAPHAELVATLELACRAAKITRALTWDRLLRALDPTDVDEQWKRVPLQCLAALAERSFVGSG